MDQKIEILKVILVEKYTAIHAMRKRVQEICLWSLGLLVAASGWLIKSELVFSNYDKIIFILVVLIGYLILRYSYFVDLEHGFKQQHRILVKIEKALHLYSPGYFSEDKSSLYPESWQNAGTEKGNGKFFKTNYHLLQFGVIVFIIAIMLNGCV